MKKRNFLRIAIDLEGTILEEKDERERAGATPLVRAVEAVNALYQMGHTIIIYTARTYRELELTLGQLKQYGIKYHHLVLGKPVADIFIDDRAISFTDWSASWDTLLQTIGKKMEEPVLVKSNPMQRPTTVLISAAGSTNGINAIKALRSQKEYPIRIVAIDCDPDAAGLYLADQYLVAPRVSDPAFPSFVSNACQRYNVDIVMPTHSVELPFYSANQKIFTDLGIKIMISPLEKSKICDDKMELAKFFSGLGVRHPRIYDQTDIPEDEFPLLVKSRSGSGSTYVQKVENGEELRFYLGRIPNPLVQEYVEGTEYTVNVISDYDAKVVGLVPLRRIRVRGGLAMVAQVEMNSAIAGETKRVVEALGLIGPSNVQVIKSGQELVFIEVNPRFAAGGMPLAAHAGLNVPLLMIKLMLGEQIGGINIADGKKMIRYLDFVIID